MHSAENLDEKQETVAGCRSPRFPPIADTSCAYGLAPVAHSTAVMPKLVEERGACNCNGIQVLTARDLDLDDLGAKQIQCTGSEAGLMFISCMALGSAGKTPTSSANMPTLETKARMTESAWSVSSERTRDDIV